MVGDTEIARSEATDDDLKYLRVYTEPERYAHLTGFYSFVLGRAGLERRLNEHLTGAPTDVAGREPRRTARSAATPRATRSG